MVAVAGDLVVESNDRGRVVLWSLASGDVVAWTDVVVVDGDSIDVRATADGRLVAVSYWRRGGVDVIDVATGDVVATVGPMGRRTGILGVSGDGSQVAFWSAAGSAVLDCGTGRGVRLTNIDYLMRATPSWTRGTLSIPTMRKGLVLRIGWAGLEVREHRLPIDKTIRSIVLTADEESAVVLDRSSTVHWMDEALEVTRWSTSVARLRRRVDRSGRSTLEFASGASPSGDGTLVAVGLHGPVDSRTVVLDASSGAVVDIIEHAPGSSPYRGTAIAYPARRQTLDLADGQRGTIPGRGIEDLLATRETGSGRGPDRTGRLG